MGESARLTSRSVKVQATALVGSKISIVPFSKRISGNASSLDFRQRQQAGCAPGAVGAAGHPQRRPANDHPRGLELAAEQIGQIGGAGQETFVEAQELGPRPFRRGIDDRQPAEGYPLALHQHGRVDLDLHARILVGKQFLDAAADLVDPCGDRNRAPGMRPRSRRRSGPT